MSEGTEACAPKMEPDKSKKPTEVAKRQRISFVCQACRKNKTKCDREKPRCGRCVKYNLECVYDVEKQKPPRVPSKDAVIKRLTREVEYWKRKAEENHSQAATVNGSPSSVSDAESLPMVKRQRTVDGISLLADVSTLSPAATGSSDQSAVGKTGLLVPPDAKSLQLNFCKEFPQLTMKYAMKRDVKPVSAFAHVYRDKLLSLFVASIFSSASKNALIHSLPTDGTNAFQKSEAQFKQNAFFLRDSMLQLCETDVEKEKVIEFTERIMGEQSEHKEKCTLFVSFLKAKLENKYIEDTCFHGNMSPELILLKETLEKSLPTLEHIQIYKEHFYKYIYASIPFLDVELFEEGLAELLSPSDGTDGRRVHIDFGRRNIRSKICLIAALMNILRISYLCMTFTFSTSRTPVFDDATVSVLTTFPITADMIKLSQECVSTVNILSWTTENGLLALMYHWAVYVFTPEEGDYYLGQPTDALISLISNLAVNIGLHRDPADYKILKDATICDPRLHNLRKRLWLSIFMLCRLETTLRARYHQNPHIFSTTYASSNDPAKPFWCYDFTNTNPTDMFILNANNKLIKRHQLFLLLSEADAVTMNLDTSLSLHDLDSWFQKVGEVLDEEFPLHDLINGVKNPTSYNLSIGEGKHIPINFSFFENTVCFQMHLLARSSMLRVSTCLMIHFENRLNDTTNNYLPYFVKYFKQSFKVLLELIKLYQSYLSGDYDASLSPSMKYATDKMCEVCLPSLLLTYLSMLIRATHSEHTLTRKTINRKGLYEPSSYIAAEMKENEEKLVSISAIKRGLESGLQNVLSLTTRRLRFAFFSTFKISIFFDYVLQIVKKQDILNVLKRLCDLIFADKVRREVYMGTGVDINDKHAVVMSLDRGNRICVCDNDTFQEILAMMDALQICNYSNDIAPVSNLQNVFMPSLDKFPVPVDTPEKIEDTSPTLTGPNRLAGLPENEILETYNVSNLFNGPSFDFFDYDFLLGPTD